MMDFSDGSDRMRCIVAQRSCVPAAACQRLAHMRRRRGGGGHRRIELQGDGAREQLQGTGRVAVDRVAEYRAAEQSAVHAYLVRAAGAGVQFQPPDVASLTTHLPVGHRALPGRIADHAPARGTAMPAQPCVDRAVFGWRHASYHGPVGLLRPPAAKSACAAISAERRNATTRQPEVSASNRCASHGPSLRRDSSGNQSSTLGPPRGPECTGKPGGLSSTTKRSSRNKMGGMAEDTSFPRVAWGRACPRRAGNWRWLAGIMMTDTS